MSYALINGIILDGKEDMVPVKDKAVLVKDGRIEGITDNEDIPEGYEKVDLKGAYLLPGLIDLHVHLATSGKPPKADRRPPNYKKLFDILSRSRSVLAVIKRLTAGYAKTELMSGVTTIRTVAGILDMDGRVRDGINE